MEQGAPDPSDTPLLAKQVWTIHARLELAGNIRASALFNLEIDSKLRGCDLVRLKVIDQALGDLVFERTTVVPSKTQRPLQLEVSENARDSLREWVCRPNRFGCLVCSPGRFDHPPQISTRRYARVVQDWVATIGLDPSGHRTHSPKHTKAARFYPKTGNLLLLTHTKMDSTVRYVGDELETALSIAERVDI